MKKQGTDVVQDGMMGYSAYVLLQRAIPSLYDGLKVSYRRILYSMYDNNINNFTKSQNIVGEVSKIHPHGSIYPSLVGMAQKDRHIQPFIDGKGNFGDYTSKDLTPAAERYTSVRLNDYSRFLMKDIKKEQIDFSPSYDGTRELPDLLPVKFPLVLAFAQSGMGVGFSSTTASYNIGEIADNIIEYLENGQLSNLIPDFATGGDLLLNNDIIEGINNKGRGTLRIRASATINDNTISVTEIPYSTTREAIIDRVVDLAKTDKLKEVTNIQDLTGLDKMEILITARKDTDMKILLEKLYSLTTMESTYSVNSTVLYEDRPRLLGIKDIIINWIQWRRECVKKELQYDINKLDGEKTNIAALKAMSEDIDFVIDTIRNNNKLTSVKIIREHFKLTFSQSEYIYGLHLKQLNSEYIKKQLIKLKEIEDKIKTLKNTNEDDVIISDMKYYKQHFNSKRRTGVIDPEDIQQLRQKATQTIRKSSVDDNDYWIIITENDYVYKTTKKTLNLKGDKIIGQYKMNNAEDEIFTYMKDRSRGYKIQIRDLELYNGSGLGEYLPALFDINPREICSYGISSKNYPIIVLILTSGRIVKFNYSSYRSGVKVFANTHTEDYDITHTLFLKNDKELKLVDTKNNKLNINTGNIRATKTRQGSGQFIHSSRRNDIKSVK